MKILTKLGIIPGILALLQVSAPTRAQNVIDDGSFEVPTTPNSSGFTMYSSGATFGAWKVTAGSVDVQEKSGAFMNDARVVGKTVDICGNVAGTITQEVETRQNDWYTLTFKYSGNWNNTSDAKGVEVSLGSQIQHVWYSRPAGWSNTDAKWKVQTIRYQAKGPLTLVKFRALNISHSGMVLSEVRLDADPPRALSTIRVPLPDQLDKFVKNRSAAIQLGKALFWDMQVGSDGRTACATCHNNAGIDQRTINMLNPGAPGSNFGPQLAGQQALQDTARGQFPGANRQLAASDFPFHQVADPLGDHSSNRVLRSLRQVVGSAGVVKQDFVSINSGNSVDNGRLVADPIFNIGGANTRQVTGRNTPTMINAVYFDRLFWDGRANHFFNGVNPFGDLDPNASILRAGKRTETTTVWGPKWVQLLWWGYWGWGSTTTTTTIDSLDPEKILLNNAALASQAVGPPNNSVEMSWNGRLFKDLGRKMLSLKPLALQQVANTDSVLGGWAEPTKGLRTTYQQMIRDAFHDVYWNSPATTSDSYTLMESNFSLYWGLSLMMYQSTLVSDRTPYDSFASGNSSAISDSAKRGLKIFLNEGKCINCHGGPEFAGATISDIRTSTPSLIERMVMGNGKTAVYDGGFYNIGVRPTLEDLGVGARHPQFGPLSYTAQRQGGRNIGQSETVSPSERIAVNGAFKTASLRNIELTGPYFHNGGTRTLRDAVAFYVRGSDFRNENINDLDPDVDGISELQGNPAAVDDLVNFLKTLTDDRVRFQRAPFDHPELVIPNGQSGSDQGVALDNLLTIPAVGSNGGAEVRSFEQILP